MLTDLIEDVLQAEATPEDAETFMIDWLRRRAGRHENRTASMSLHRRSEALKQEFRSGDFGEG